MERITYDFALGGNHCWQVKGADNLECREVCERQGDVGCKTCPIAKAFDRLAAIEDILGDEYDLDRLRELAQADREGRVHIYGKSHKCPICGAYRLVPRVDGQFYFCFHCKNQVTREEAQAALRREQNDRN